MNRREALERSAMILGYAITGPALVGIMNGCTAKPAAELTFKPMFLSEQQAQLVSALSEIIIPKTSTPGAIDVGVPGFIDDMISQVYPKADQERFVKGLTAFDEEAKSKYGNSFANCEHKDQVAMVKKQHEALAGKATDTSAGWWRAAGGEKPFIIEMKELTLLGFFSSKPGATEVLQYNQAPGPFKGCVPLTEVGKAWAT